MVGKKKAKGEGFEQGVNSLKKQKNVYIFSNRSPHLCR